MTHRARLIYKKYGDKVRFISNYKLNDIPYIPLINFNQLVDIGEEEDSKYEGTVVLIDEVENVLSHRNFANFPLPLLHTLTQQRKKRVYVLASAQRFFIKHFAHSRRPSFYILSFTISCFFLYFQMGLINYIIDGFKIVIYNITENRQPDNIIF